MRKPSAACVAATCGFAVSSALRQTDGEISSSLYAESRGGDWAQIHAPSNACAPGRVLVFEGHQEAALERDAALATRRAAGVDAAEAVAAVGPVALVVAGGHHVGQARDERLHLDVEPATGPMNVHGRLDTIMNLRGRMCAIFWWQ